MIRVPLREGRTLHHDVKGRFGAGKVVLRAAPPGTGIIAGGPMRAVFETLGVQDVVAKSIGHSEPHNMIRATFDALKKERASPAHGRPAPRQEGRRSSLARRGDAPTSTGRSEAAEGEDEADPWPRKKETVTVTQIGSPIGRPPTSARP